MLCIVTNENHIGSWQLTQFVRDLRQAFGISLQRAKKIADQFPTTDTHRYVMDIECGTCNSQALEKVTVPVLKCERLLRDACVELIDLGNFTDARMILSLLEEAFESADNATRTF